MTNPTKANDAGNRRMRSSLGAPSTARSLTISCIVAVAVAYGAIVLAGDGGWRRRAGSLDSLPPQTVLVDPKSFAVLGETHPFRESSFTTFNPTATPPPFFQAFDESFLSVLGPTPSLREVASNVTFAFAHEAPIYDPTTNDVFFSSNNGGTLGRSGLEHNNVIGKISLAAVDAANQSAFINVPVSLLDFPETIQMTNGGTGPYKSSLLLTTSGRGHRPPSLALANPKPPYNVTILIDNFFGRQFNSLNDVKVHPSGMIFFTDTVYGYLVRFRAAPLLPSQVYRLDPDTRALRVVAADFNKCNGIAFSADGLTAYVSDTGSHGGFQGMDQTAPATIYAFDVDPRTHVFRNRRVFAYVDAGVPDGIQVDTNGNVYSGCADGVQVWNKAGTLIGKFFLGMVSANMVFANPGRLVILAETKVFVADIAAKGVPLVPQ